MKNRKTVIVAFMLIAVMLLGVGYAALNDELIVNGTAGVDVDDTKEVFDGDIYFSKVISGDGCAAVIDSADPDKGEITVTDGALKEVGNEVIATYTIKSESDLDVTITKPTFANGKITNNNSEYFDVYVNWVNDTMTLPAGQTIDVVVTIKLIKTADADQDVTFALTFDAQSN